MIQEGAFILDIGGQSTRPGSVQIGANEEMDRVVPVIESVKKAFPSILVSVDTYHPTVAMAAVNAGADIVNDISGGRFFYRYVVYGGFIKCTLYLYAQQRHHRNHA
jgi:dihydropteroate synthase